MPLIAGLLATGASFARQEQSKGLLQQRPVTGFHSLEVSGLARVYLTRGNEEKAAVKVTGMPAGDVIVAVTDSVLKVSTRGSHNGETVKVYVSYRNLKRISVSDAAELHGENTVKASNLNLSVSGNAAAILDVNVQTLDITTKDAGDLKISGKTGTQTIHSTGARGTLDNSALQVTKL